MDRSKLHRLFKRHRGELAKLARELGVDLTSLSNWFLRGMTSARIERAVCERAEELLASEERETHVLTQQHRRLFEFAGARP
jgi:ATP phosphoribosyltransferase regulatory subunit HisZ